MERSLSPIANLDNVDTDHIQTDSDQSKGDAVGSMSIEETVNIVNELNALMLKDEGNLF